MNVRPLSAETEKDAFENLALQYKALADPKRLEILNTICRKNSACVCDLTEVLDLPQSKLSYHLKILLNARLLNKETKGTWSFYSINQKEMNRLISNQICNVITPSC
ncbi:ArsR/SmtB family transcription factor [Planomicrobium okeanokoites]|uniref:ArsR/SmtB family transcription factor n=1 Tax=Planomicrobium okeanokoites TaxID=244 RepID=A0ABV7KQ32_PLAOK|nr:metalloregulator ArsR/SmtB family transcription factor [Planomicrobium okeanokoites]TAA71078.1 transcriptional regulator [Planomicrobium okeanokoites]